MESKPKEQPERAHAPVQSDERSLWPLIKQSPLCSMRILLQEATAGQNAENGWPWAPSSKWDMYSYTEGSEDIQEEEVERVRGS